MPKKNATIPILEHHSSGHGAIQTVHYINPLPHVLMLTAIVVAVATLGVALAMVIKIHKDYNTIEEDRIVPWLTVDSGTKKGNHMDQISHSDQKELP